MNILDDLQKNMAKDSTFDKVFKSSVTNLKSDLLTSLGGAVDFPSLSYKVGMHGAKSYRCKLLYGVAL